MTNQRPLPADDPRQFGPLNTFLDGLAHGNLDPPRELDPTLAATVRHVYGMANDSVAADVRGAGKAQRWEELMRSQTPSAAMTPSIVPPFPGSRTLPSSTAPPPLPFRPTVPPSRLRRWGGRSLGLVATLTLVLLVAASGLAVYLTAPRGGGEPTMFPAAFGASPEATPVSISTPVDDTPVDAARVTTVECTVEALQLDEVMGVLSAPSAGLPFDESYLESFDIDRLSGVGLADGAPVAQQTRDNLTDLYGKYLGCYLPLQQARFFSDAGLLRYYRTQESPLQTAQLYELLWLDQKGEVSPPGADPTFLDLGRPGRSYLYDFRMLGSDRVGAYIAINQGLNTDDPPQFEEAGFVVFVSIDGQWLIDEDRPVPAG